MSAAVKTELGPPHPIVAACAADRDAIVAAPLTIAEGIFRARQMLRTSEQLGPNERAVITALLAGIEYSPVYAKAIMRGQRTFVLVEQDRAAPYAIRTWSEISGKHGTTIEKVREAERAAQEWDQSKIQRKWAD